MRQNASAPGQPAYLSFSGLYWRSLAALLVFQALGWGLAAVLAYLVAAPALAKDYFSAHQGVKAAGQLLVPALAAAAGIGFLVVGAGTALSVWRYSRRLRAPFGELDAVLRQLAAGRVPAPGPPTKRPRAADEAAALLEPLRGRVAELQRVNRNLQKTALELNYRAAGAGEVTVKDLRGVAGQLDALARELDETARWFEG